MHRRGLTDSRQQARTLIDDGRVLVGGAPAPKAARLVAPGEPIQVLGPPARFVGRGGEKLDGALVRFALDVRGRRALDAGSSTGGFTDALLQAGAASVVAVDVGRAQLHERLRDDPRVDVREQTDIRTVTPDSVGGGVDVVVADLSFISVRRVVDALVALVSPGGDLVVLVKPQFEAGRAEASRGRGVIRDPQVWRRVLLDAMSAVSEAGAAIMGGMVSPLRGADGNAEFLVHARRPAPTTAPGPMSPTSFDALVDLLVAEASGAPTHRCLVLTPVSPHMLFDRTLVLDPHTTLRLEVTGHRPATVSVDGRNLVTLAPGDSLECTASPRTARLVTFGDHDFLGILKTKFGLADR